MSNSSLRLHLLLVFLLLLLLVIVLQTQGYSNHSSTLVRKRRALVFPKGTNFVMTLTLIKAVQAKLAPNWNLDLEFDMLWPIPPGTDAWKARIPSKTAWKRRQRRELYANLELALDSQGLPGKLCLLRSICEAKLILNPRGVSLIEDVLRVVLSYPWSSKERYDAYDHAFTSRQDCDSTFSCPFSMLDLLLNYDDYMEDYAAYADAMTTNEVAAQDDYNNDYQ